MQMAQHDEQIELSNRQLMEGAYMVSERMAPGQLDDDVIIGYMQEYLWPPPPPKPPLLHLEDQPQAQVEEQGTN